MKTLGKIAAALFVVGAIGVTGVISASADWYGRYHHRYYNYGGGYSGYNPCGRGWSLQGGRCQPYHFGPWDVYGGRHQDWGYR
jgi:hypothetical protein